MILTSGLLLGVCIGSGINYAFLGNRSYLALCIVCGFGSLALLLLKVRR